MRITFIGTSHGVPEPHRRCSSYLLETGGKYYIIDMGTQTIEDLRLRQISIDDVKLVICTHPHGDHTDGLISFVDLVNWYFRSAAPTILLPDERLLPPLRGWIAANTDGGSIREGITFGIVEEGEVFDDGAVRITAVRNQHCVNAFSYFVEAEGKKLLFTGDLRHPSVDFPERAFREELDLIVCSTVRAEAITPPKQKSFPTTPRWT